MKLMREKQIYAVPTFAIAEYFAEHAATPPPPPSRRRRAGLPRRPVQTPDGRRRPLRRRLRRRPLPPRHPGPRVRAHGPVRHEPPDVLRAGLINGAKLLDWEGKIGQLKPGFFADIIAVPGNPIENIAAVTKVAFVMKNGIIYKP